MNADPGKSVIVDYSYTDKETGQVINKKFYCLDNMIMTDEWSLGYVSQSDRIIEVDYLDEEKLLNIIEAIYNPIMDGLTIICSSRLGLGEYGYYILLINAQTGELLNQFRETERGWPHDYCFYYCNHGIVFRVAMHLHSSADPKTSISSK